METQTIPEPFSHDKKVFLSGKQLAQMLNVSPPTLSEAVKNGHNCGGYPVAEWAIETGTGRVKGYDVPEFLVSKGPKKDQQRPNPETNEPNKANISPNRSKEAQGFVQSVIHNHYSLLPEGEDYTKPIGILSFSSIIKKAIDSDTPMSKGIIFSIIMMLGAITGRAISDSTWGAIIGGAAGIGTASAGYCYFNNQFPQQTQTTTDYKLPVAKPNNSGFIQDLNSLNTNHYG
ncbi:MAG TPA: hypothetical protein VF181_10055 [Balneolaceae bacterium]